MDTGLYLEMNLPIYLKHDLDAFVNGYLNDSSLLDCLFGELYGSINSAEWDGEISPEQAMYLRDKYLYGDYLDNLCNEKLKDMNK